MTNPFLNIFSGALGEANTQRLNNQQLQQALQTILFQKQIEQDLAQAQQKRNFENYQKYSEMFGSGFPGGGQSIPQATQPSLQNIFSQAPKEQQPMMSLPSGGVGNAQGQPIDLAAVLNRIQMQGQSSQPQAQQGQQPFVLNPSSMFSGEMSFIQNPAYESPVQEARAKRLDMGNSTRIRQEFINRPEVKDYILVKTKAEQMDALLNGALSGNLNNKVALQQGIITLFNKITDPQSVVRESEYARTPGNIPIINRISGAYQKLQQGGAGITNDDLKALVIGAKILANESGKIYQNTLNEYKALAGDLGLDEKTITRGMENYQDFEVGFPMQTQQSGQNNLQDLKSKYGLR